MLDFPVRLVCFRSFEYKSPGQMVGRVGIEPTTKGL